MIIAVLSNSEIVTASLAEMPSVDDKSIIAIVVFASSGAILGAIGGFGGAGGIDGVAGHGDIDAVPFGTNGDRPVALHRPAGELPRSAGQDLVLRPAHLEIVLRLFGEESGAFCPQPPFGQKTRSA